MKQAGQPCSVLNIDPRAPESNAYIKISGGADLAWQLFRHAWNDWTLNVHTNGHNRKSWLIALMCGVAGQFGGGATLTLHSGAAPEYLGTGSSLRRLVAQMACLLYGHVVCVNTQIADVLAALGTPRDHVEVKPAFSGIETVDVRIPDDLERWIRAHAPVISSALFFRPEYGFELLVDAVRRLKLLYPRIGGLIMGIGEENESAMAIIKKAGVRNAIHLAGDVDHDLSIALMARSSIFVRPTYIDGDSISVREALSLGVPVVASNVGARPDGVELFEAGAVEGLVQGIVRTVKRGNRSEPCSGYE